PYHPPGVSNITALKDTRCSSHSNRPATASASTALNESSPDPSQRKSAPCPVSFRSRMPNTFCSSWQVGDHQARARVIHQIGIVEHAIGGNRSRIERLVAERHIRQRVLPARTPRHRVDHGVLHIAKQECAAG